MDLIQNREIKMTSEEADLQIVCFFFIKGNFMNLFRNHYWLWHVSITGRSSDVSSVPRKRRSRKWNTVVVVERESDRWLASILSLTCFGTYPFHRYQFLNFYYERIRTSGRFLPTCLRRRDTCHITRHFVRDSRAPEEILTARNLRYQRIFYSWFTVRETEIDRRSMRKDHARIKLRWRYGDFI